MSSRTDADGSTDGGYVHTPESGVDEPEDPDGSGTVDDAAGSAPDSPATSEPEVDGFGRKGWVLTAVLFTCVLVIPGLIYVYPYVAGVFGFTFFATYLALPLIPAILLGAVAVWSMTAATRTQ